MENDLILEELWQIKDELSREMAADPAAYAAKLDGMVRAEGKAGRRIIRSAAELRQFVAEQERSAPPCQRWRSTTNPRTNRVNPYRYLP